MGQDDQWHAKRGSLSGSDHPEVALGPKLHLHRHDDGPTNIVAKSKASSRTGKESKSVCRFHLKT